MLKKLVVLFFNCDTPVLRNFNLVFFVLQLFYYNAGYRTLPNIRLPRKNVPIFIKKAIGYNL